jgi:radical SAM superfamily enzyme YgiQ (UPF0313 family)
MIGISLMSIEYSLALEISLILKNKFPQSKIIWGGVHPTIAPEDCIDHADFACVGEGEEVIVEIARKLSIGEELHSVYSLCYRDGDGVAKRNPLYPLNYELDSLTHYEHIPENAFVLDSGEVRRLTPKMFIRKARYHGKSYAILASRGCPYSCSYCCNNVFNKLNDTFKVRRRSPENIVREIEKAVKDNSFISFINFQDDCFVSMNPKDMHVFADLYKNRVARPFAINAIPVYLDADKLDVLKDAGLAGITMGLQSGSDRVLREIYNRKSQNKDIYRVVKLCNERKIATWIDVIVDNPFEFDEDSIQTIEVLASLNKPYYLQIYSLALYYGTDLYKKVPHPQNLWEISGSGKSPNV